jgi:hypothetical protein
MTDENRDRASTLEDLYQRLIQINQEAFAGEYYDVAYNSICGWARSQKHLLQSCQPDKNKSTDDSA